MRSVRTTFQVLDAVAELQPIGLSELARRLELPKSTVQRSLAVLAELGWISPEGGDATRWVLGERARTLSEKIDDVGRLREVCAPFLEKLNNETSETIHLAVAENRTTRLIERVDAKHALRLVRPIGTRSALHSSSTGKAVLAFLPDEEIESYIEQGLEATTSHTIVDPGQLRAELDRIRARGYATAQEEQTEGIASVAASVRPAGRRPVASISVSGPVHRMTVRACEEYGRLVTTSVEQISGRLEHL